MRRIYESDALHRDDDDPAVPNERAAASEPQAMRSLNATWLSRRLVPERLRNWGVSVAVSTPRAEYPAGGSVPFTVTMKNSMPFPVSLPTVSPVPWTWSVDGFAEASRVPLHDPPDSAGRFHFDRGERKQFRKRWNQMFRVSEAEWEPAGPGEYTLGAAVNVTDAAGKGLRDETTIRILPD